MCTSEPPSSRANPSCHHPTGCCHAQPTPPLRPHVRVGHAPQNILTVTGGLDCSPPATSTGSPAGHSCFDGALAAAQQHSLQHEVLSGQQVNQRFPGFQLSADFKVWSWSARLGSVGVQVIRRQSVPHPMSKVQSPVLRRSTGRPICHSHTYPQHHGDSASRLHRCMQQPLQQLSAWRSLAPQCALLTKPCLFHCFAGTDWVAWTRHIAGTLQMATLWCRRSISRMGGSWCRSGALRRT